MMDDTQPPVRAPSGLGLLVNDPWGRYVLPRFVGFMGATVSIKERRTM